MKKTLLNLFFCFFWSIFTLSASSFDNIQGVLERSEKQLSAAIAEQVYTKISEIHTCFAREQNALYSTLPKDTSSTTTSQKGARSETSSRQTKSSNSRIPDLSTANFAMAFLCVITETDQIIELPIVNMGSQAIYDSCSDRTHNAIPGLAACQEQWQKYLSVDAAIFNPDTESVKQNIGKSKETLKSLIDVLIQQCENQEFEGINISQIEKEIARYYGFIKTWHAYGCHSEQRALYDIDSSHVEERLTRIQSEFGIKLIAACLHTRLAPCIAKVDPPTRRTCDCYHCLRNWADRWNFKQRNPDIQTLMTVSYTEYPKQIPESEYAPEIDNPRFFLKKIDIDESAEVDLARGQKWLNDELSFSWHHMNFYKTDGVHLNEYEHDLMEIMRPLLERCQTVYENKKNISLTFANLKLQRKYHLDGKKFLSLNNWPGEVEATTVKLIDEYPDDPIQITISAHDSDWSLLLKFYAISFLQV